ncbi:hypothetical protein KC343_g1602 [Hortaea werneckii]|uniref:Uncharacterized protein n=1 Tax=Hortaea werneckii TaxID=91943 RepID=A0A3M7FAJ8_HORWE|nr:hypothetical protein KC352_g6867 [Hortaea werneckii]KAI7557064.1 hypothetical protein KC317_g11860 [Hortaea werneckii]KAI7612976.1 hypothetical protein KC346_g7551 [Hortaea werneckii]KAI7635818.1 hypothetical protein KC343_g1602 [Hortaea werneckii]KAI7682219.1 hypothetical protein KC319_g1127 [Hortaea werneckii]
MAPDRPIDFSQLLWKEALPVGGFVGVLYSTLSYLKYPQWASPVATLYVWTAIWFTLSLISLRCLYRHGPFYVAGSGWMQSLLMLWDLYKKTDGTEPSLRLEDVVYAGLFTTVAVATNCYILATRVRMDYSPALPAADESGEAEKT